MAEERERFLTDTRKFAIYSRKSKFTEKGDSIKNQVSKCREHILSHFEGAQDEDILIFEDEGFSGGNTNRPKFKEMMAAVKRNELKAIVVYRLDRISRDILDFNTMYQQLQRMHVEFISESETFDTTTPMGRAMMQITTIFAQLERETTALRIRDNMLELAKTGRWLGGMTPTGFQSVPVEYVTVDGKKRRLFQLDAIPEEAETIRLIFRLFLELNSLTQTETYLLQNHIKTKTGKDFTRFSIKNILQNPVYMTADSDAWRYFAALGAEVFAKESDFNGSFGVISYNKTNQKTDKSHEMRDISEWIIAVGKHPGLISGADWVKAQQLLAQNTSKAYRKPRSNVALLSGLLFCAHCNGFMRPKLTARENAAGEKIYNYLCETKEKSRRKNCDVKTLNGNELDKAVVAYIKELKGDRSTFLRELEELKRSIAGSSNELDGQLDHLRKALQEVRKEISSCVDVLTKVDGTAAHDHVLQRITELDEKEKGLAKRIEELEAIDRNGSYSDEALELLSDRLSYFRQAVDTMTVEQKRAALREFIQRITWDGENIRITLFPQLGGAVNLTGIDEETGEAPDPAPLSETVDGEPLRGDREPDPDAFPEHQKNGRGCLHQRSNRDRQGRQRAHPDGYRRG